MTVNQCDSTYRNDIYDDGPLRCTLTAGHLPESTNALHEAARQGNSGGRMVVHWPDRDLSEGSITLTAATTPTDDGARP